jgi:hypothetical protein
MLHPTNRTKFRAALAASAVLALASGSAEAAECQTANGKVELTAVTGPECTSPAGLCVKGDLNGLLTGTGFTTVTSITPTADTPTTSVVLLTADSLVTTKNGTLTLKEAIVFQTAGAGEFSELDDIVAGTGSWEGATGVLKVEGTFNGTTGAADYEAKVCGS